MKLGIYGGTFSPPHKTHLRIAAEFLDEYCLDRLFIVPASVPPHKKIAASDSPVDRFRMAELNFASLGEKTSVSDVEMRRDGPSYTSETLLYFRGQFPVAELYLLCGEDMFLTLSHWHEAKVIFECAHIVCAKRSGNTGEIEAKKAEYERMYGARVSLLDSAPVEMASTDVRQLIQAGEPADSFLVPEVYAYIKNHGLYGFKMKTITEESLSQLREAVQPYLTDKRYKHTLAVESEAAALCGIFMPDDGATAMKMRAAALLHDITKKANIEKQLNYCREFGIITDEYFTASPKLFHARTAAALIPSAFPDFADPVIISAVKWHTTGRCEMTLCDIIVYLADYIEPTRDFPDCIKLREYFYIKLANSQTNEEKFETLRKTLVLSFDMTMTSLIADKAPIDADTTAARNRFIVKPFEICNN